MKPCKTAGVLVSLKGIIVYSKWLYLVRKAVLNSSPSCNLIRLYALFSSSLLKIFESFKVPKTKVIKKGVGLP